MNRVAKSFVIGCLIAVFGTLFTTSSMDLAYAIFIRVNGRPITQDNVAQAEQYLLKREYRGEVPEDQEEQIRINRAAIRDLVRTQLIHSEAASIGIKLSPGESRRAIAMSGLRPDEVSPTIRRMLEADDLFDMLMSAEGTPVRDPSPKEVRDFYLNSKELFRNDAYIIVRTIFIADDGTRSQSYFRDRATQIMNQVNMMPLSQRTDFFAKAAREVSQDVFAEFGGLLTGSAEDSWLPQGFTNRTPDGSSIFPEPMVEAIRQLKTPGEVRLAVSEDGIHLLYLENLRGGNIVPWSEAKRVVEYFLRQKVRVEALRGWINRIYDRSDVRWHNGETFEKERLTESLLPTERGM